MKYNGDDSYDMNCLLLILIFLFSSPCVQYLSDEELVRRGLELEQQGKPEAALELWQGAAGQLEVPFLALATEYLRVATEHELQAYYRSASALYQWGLSGRDEKVVEKNREALREELTRLEPLFGRKGNKTNTFKQLERLLSENNPIIFEELRIFWERLDLTPGRLYNERLIEHWQRIAHARKHFTRKNDPPYGTDERGVAYVKYGPPHRKADGILRAPRQKVINLCRQLGSCNDEELMADVIFDLQTRPYYEIWIYNRPEAEMRYNLLMIFGDKPAGGFDRIDVIEELIPSRAFTFTDRFNFLSLRRQAAGLGQSFEEFLTPGMILQWLYYEQLATTDFFFADRYSEIIFAYDRADPGSGDVGKYQGPAEEQRARELTRENLAKAPSELSTYADEFPSIPLEIYQYRLLDDEDDPVFVTFFESSPMQAVLGDVTANQDVMMAGSGDESEDTAGEQLFSWYRLTHGLQLRDGRWQLLSQSRQSPSVVLDPEENTPSTSVFVIPYLKETASQVFYAELENLHPDSRPVAESLFPEQLRARHKLELPLPDPLPVTPGELIAGDLILGYQKAGQPPEDVLFDFVVSNRREIPEGENLVVHFEVYQLQTDASGIARFEVDYEIRPRGGLFGWTKTKLDEFSITLGFE
ncbi:MAG: GWxTD domain-containing protein, partial [Balneolaceae bacterium]